MKVLMVHNRYQQRGGEDAVVDAETTLLATNGVEVQRFDADNDSIQGLISKIQASAGQFGLPSDIKTRFKKTLQDSRPDVVHVHNWFPTLSPSIFSICRSAHVPVVHTLHNYRLLCVAATFFRNGQVCEDCLGTTFRAPGIIHSCYRDSFLGSAVATAGMAAHWTLGTWSRSVDRFIALSRFAQAKLREGGLPADKIAIKPNFVDPAPVAGDGRGRYFLHAGRLTEEKGIHVLLDCWKGAPDLPLLNIAGTGPLMEAVKHAAATMPNVAYLGAKSADQVTELMRDAVALICPSLWYEGMPRVVIESFATGTPVVASFIGCYPEMIGDGVTGALFPTGDPTALRNRLLDLARTDALGSMRLNARRSFEANYSGEKNLSLLLGIYRSVLSAGRMTASSPVPART
jgi:glycosyltransferase involved in cell wall biosynthesis